MTFKLELTKKKKKIEKYLETFFLNYKNDFEKKLFESMRYSLLAGGKRIRPILLIEIGELFGSKFDDLIDYACALEMIHTYSLIHDDLPSMDDDDLRRGRPTNHIVYGEDMAILAGDGLLNSAFELMLTKAIKVEQNGYLHAFKAISSASGVNGMIVGQVADILSENIRPNKETLNYIHINKTSALLTAALLAGGHIGSVDEATIATLEKLGLNIGLSFQIKDDILDIESTTKELGKPVGSDDKNSKLTYPSLYGMDESYKMIEELEVESLKILKKYNGDTKFLEDLVTYLKNRSN